MNNLFKSKIFIKLTSVFGILMILFSVILGSVFISIFRNNTFELNKASMEKRATAISSTLSNIKKGEHGGYKTYMRFIDSLEDGEVWIVASNKSITSNTHRNHYFTDVSELPDDAAKIVDKVLSGEKTYSNDFSNALGSSSITVGVPIINADNIEGAVLLHAPVSGIDTSVNQGLKALLIGLAFSLFILGIAAIFFAYHFTKPLSKINNVALSLSKGDYEAKTNVKTKDEIGQLAQSVDNLALKLDEARKERENLDNMRNRFISNVSHELRTPVAVLSGSVEQLLDGTIEDENMLKEYYKQMLSESRHLERLINDLFELSKLQDEGFKLDKAVLNFSDIVSDALRSMRKLSIEKNIKIDSHITEDECLVFGDYGRLRQLLIILLDNAIKFSKNGSKIDVFVKLNKSVNEKNYFIELSIKNYQAKIPEDELPYIFDRFSRSFTSDNKNGSGLGLFVASEIVKRHNGKITARSDFSETVFTACFPAYVEV